MFGVVDLVVNLYRFTPLSVRFCYAIWILFIGLYLYSSLYEKHNNKKIPRKVKKRNWPYTLYILGALSIIIYYFSSNSNDSIFPMVSWKMNVLSINIGFIIMLMGLIIVSFARAAIDGYWGPNIYEYSSSEQKLVTNGIYSHVRHPVYLGQILMTTGTVFMANQWILIFFPICTLIVNCIRALREEEELAKIFKEEYEEYKNKVPYMLPL